MKNIYALLYAFVMFIQFGCNECFLHAQNPVLFLTEIFNYFKLFDRLFHHIVVYTVQVAFLQFSKSLLIISFVLLTNE